MCSHFHKILGRITSGRRGGGAKRRYRMIDFHRRGPEDGPPMEEKVLDIKYDPNRTADIALVAGGNHKRYILATANMEIGDIIRTSAHIGRMTGETQLTFQLKLFCFV